METLRRLGRWLRQWKDWFHGNRTFRAVYPNGKRTHKMCFYEAQSLADIFDGTVVYDP